jgi:hypothetical protein
MQSKGSAIHYIRLDDIAGGIHIQVLAKFPKLEYGLSLCNSLRQFTDSHIALFAKKSGRAFFNLASSALKPLERGYKFFIELCVCEFKCVISQNKMYAKTKCHKSYKKNDKPYD